MSHSTEDTKKEVVAVADFYLDQKSPTCKGLEGEKIQNFGEKAFGLAKVKLNNYQYSFLGTLSLNCDRRKCNLLTLH